MTHYCLENPWVIFPGTPVHIQHKEIKFTRCLICEEYGICRPSVLASPVLALLLCFSTLVFLPPRLAAQSKEKIESGFTASITPWRLTLKESETTSRSRNRP